jgi:hypothetical protein
MYMKQDGFFRNDAEKYKYFYRWRKTMFYLVVY